MPAPTPTPTPAPSKKEDRQSVKKNNDSNKVFKIVKGIFKENQKQDAPAPDDINTMRTLCFADQGDAEMQCTNMIGLMNQQQDVGVPWTSEARLAETPGEERLDMSVVATIMQDSERLNKISPADRQRILAFIIKERLKGKYFLLVDIDHFHVPVKGATLFYKTICRPLLYALLFFILGLGWTVFLDGNTLHGFHVESYEAWKPDYVKELNKIIAKQIQTNVSFYFRKTNNYDRSDRFPECPLIALTAWNEWKAISDEDIHQNDGSICLMAERRRIVLIDKVPLPKETLCPPSLEVQCKRLKHHDIDENQDSYISFL